MSHVTGMPGSPEGHETPSQRVVEQRMRNRVIEYLESVSTREAQRYDNPDIPTASCVASSKVNNVAGSWLRGRLRPQPDSPC
jgi:hypothetical protein